MKTMAAHTELIWQALEKGPQQKSVVWSHNPCRGLFTVTGGRGKEHQIKQVLSPAKSSC